MCTNVRIIIITYDIMCYNYNITYVLHTYGAR
jgi:hypothetical protein